MSEREGPCAQGKLGRGGWRHGAANHGSWQPDQESPSSADPGPGPLRPEQHVNPWKREGKWRGGEALD